MAWADMSALFNTMTLKRENILKIIRSRGQHNLTRITFTMKALQILYSLQGIAEGEKMPLAVPVA